MKIKCAFIYNVRTCYRYFKYLSHLVIIGLDFSAHSASESPFY